MYRWFWHDILGLDEPITYKIRDNQKKYPLLWLLGFSALGIFLGHLFW